MRVAYVDSSWSGKSPLMGGSTAAGHGSLLLLGVGAMWRVDDFSRRLASWTTRDSVSQTDRQTEAIP